MSVPLVADQAFVKLATMVFETKFVFKQNGISKTKLASRFFAVVVIPLPLHVNIPDNPPAGSANFT